MNLGGTAPLGPETGRQRSSTPSIFGPSGTVATGQRVKMRRPRPKRVKLKMKDGVQYPLKGRAKWAGVQGNRVPGDPTVIYGRGTTPGKVPYFKPEDVEQKKKAVSKALQKALF